MEWQTETAEAVVQRDDVVAALGNVAGKFYDEMPKDWDAVMRLLNLSLCYQPAVAMVLKTAHWKRAANPKAYVATAAFRLAVKHDLVERPRFHSPYRFDEVDAGPVSNHISARLNSDGEEMTYEEQMDRMDFEFGDYFEDSKIEERIPDWLRRDQESGWHVDWVRVAECAVRKESMVDSVADILQLMALGVPRERAFEMAQDETERKAMQAAWRWVDRNWESRIVRLFARQQPPKANVTTSDKPEASPVGNLPAWDAIRRSCQRSRQDPAWRPSPTRI
jgi:hypothetical protein